MNSLYQMHSKMFHSTKVIILVEKRKEVAWLGFELTTSILEGENANHYTMDPSLCINIFFKCDNIKMITFLLCNIFELIWYIEFILEATSSAKQTTGTKSLLS